MSEGNRPAGRNKDDVVIITGAARGIGKASVSTFLAEGARVAALDIDGAELEVAAKEWDSPDVITIRSDITNEQEVAAAVAEVEAKFGRADVLVNNAGVGAYFDAAEMTQDQWDSVFAVDLKGVWLMSKYVIPGMKQRRRGSIVNIGSIHATMTIDGMFPYAAAKCAVVGLTRSLALDLAPFSVRVNTVSPGWTRTQLVQEWFDHQDDPVEAERKVLEVHPLKRICEPEEVAQVIAFLASDQASAVTAAELLVDAGLSARFAT